MTTSSAQDDLYLTEECVERQESYVFTVSKEIQEVTDEEYDRIYSILSNANIELDVSAPIYKMTWGHLIASHHGRLLNLVLLYLRLETIVSKQNIETIVCDSDLDRAYISVAQDIASEYNIGINSETNSISKLDFIQRFLKNTFLITPFFLNQILTYIWGILSWETDETELLFIPSLGRLGSALPVLNKIANGEYENYKVLISSKVSPLGRTWKWKYLKHTLNDHDLSPLTESTSIRCMSKQVRSYLQASKSLLFKSELSNELNIVLEENLDIQLDETIRYSIYEGYRTRTLLSIFFYHTSKNAIKTRKCKKMVIGGLSPSRRAMLYAGIENDCEVYYIPHGINPASTSPNPPKELIHFVSGDLEKTYYSESTQVQEEWTRIATGRPYLTELYQERGKTDTSNSSAYTGQILVATQPLPGRKELVNDVVSVARDQGMDVVIKTHPSETREMYSEYAEQSEVIQVTESDLFKHIRDSDVTVTINSNVGLESIVAGTPIIAMNKWKPLVMDPLYVKNGPISVVRDIDDLCTEIEKIDSDSIKNIQKTQFYFINQNFELDTDAAQNIVDEILQDNYTIQIG